MSVDPELTSLVHLFDDTDHVVVDAVNSRMLGRGLSVINDLSALYENEVSKKVKELIAERIIFLSNEFTIEEISKFAEDPETDLWQGLYLISKLLLPELSQESFGNQLFFLVDQLNKEINEKQTALERVEIFNHIFFHRLLFKCRDYPFTRESTTVFSSVINSRRGNPIIISIIYFLFARSIGVELYPLCFPGGFVPAYVENDKVLFYVDVFRNGEIFFENKLCNFLVGQGIDVDETIFEVRGDEILLIVYIEMLLLMYSSKGDIDMVALLNRALSFFPNERFLEEESDES